MAAVLGIEAPVVVSSVVFDHSSCIDYRNLFAVLSLSLAVSIDLVKRPEVTLCGG